HRLCLSSDAAQPGMHSFLHDALPILLQLAKQLQNLSLDGHVKCRRRLIRDDERRLAGNRSRNENPLRHAAGDLVRIRGHHSLWRSEEHTSELQSRENLVCRLLLEKKK